MQELVGRLTALDPEASETLKVVSYFDALVSTGVGAESLLRGAAALAGATVGLRHGERSLRMGADGARLPGGAAPEAGGLAREADGIRVWIERDGPPHVNDAMVLERLAIALSITQARRGTDDGGAVDAALSPQATDDERAIALARLRMDAAPALRVLALPADAPAPGLGPSAVVVTPRGPARAVICDADVEVAVPGRHGVGLAVPRERIAESWASALIALRLADAEHPVVSAEDLGGVLLVAEASDARPAPHPDAVALAGLDARALELLDALADTGSVRAVATRLGMHHSSVQQRVGVLASALGYDPRAPYGRIRYAIARTLLTLARPGL